MKKSRTGVTLTYEEVNTLGEVLYHAKTLIPESHEAYKPIDLVLDCLAACMPETQGEAVEWEVVIGAVSTNGDRIHTVKYVHAVDPEIAGQIAVEMDSITDSEIWHDDEGNDIEGAVVESSIVVCEVIPCV